MKFASAVIMALPLVFCGGLLSQSSPVVQSKDTIAQPCPNLPAKAESRSVGQLNDVKKVFVESFGDDLISREIQSMIVSSLVSSKRFTVTENRDRADAVLKGVALEKTSQEVHAYGEGTAVGAAGGGHSSSVSGSVINGNGSISGSSSGGFAARTMGINDSSVNTETINDARVAVRLVNSDGDVIWTTTQESKGAKYKGASADVADMCIKQLLRDVAKLEGNAPSQAGSTELKTAQRQ